MPLEASASEKKPFSINRKSIFALSIAVAFLAGIAAGYLPSVLTSRTYLKNQDELNSFVQDAIKYYWNGGDIKKAENEIFKGITLRGNLDAVELLFGKAAELAPQRVDLKYSLASTQILKGDYEKGLSTYQNIINSDPYAFTAGMLYCFYSKALGNRADHEASLTSLGKNFPEATEKYLKIVLTADNIIKSQINTKPEKYNYKKGAIVILGYALDKDGNAQPTLIERLNRV